MQDERYAFKGRKHLILPLLFLLPQLVITVVFFFYPAGEALMGSFYMEDSFGLSKEFVGLENFAVLFSDSGYLETLRLTLVFSLATIVLTMGTALLMAVVADQISWGGTLYKSMLIIPYATCWRTLAVPLQPFRRGSDRIPRQSRLHVESQDQRQSGVAAARHLCLMEADLIQLPLLPRRTAGHSPLAHRSGGH